MTDRNWFSENRADGSTQAVVMDDLTVTIDRSGLIEIDGPASGGTTVDVDDAVVLAVVLSEAVSIMRARGWTERDDVSAWLRAHERN